MTQFRVQRPGDIDLMFEGELLADESSRYDQKGKRPVDPSRWTEVRIYRLASGRGWVTEMVGKSIRDGEVDRPKVTVCDSPEQVRDSLRRDDLGYLINVALDALEEAAENDPRLAVAIVECI